MISLECLHHVLHEVEHFPIRAYTTMGIIVALFLLSIFIYAHELFELSLQVLYLLYIFHFLEFKCLLLLYDLYLISFDDRVHSQLVFFLELVPIFGLFSLVILY